jgi:hypothetical protein
MSKHTPGPWKVVDREPYRYPNECRWAIEQVEPTQPNPFWEWGWQGVGWARQHPPTHWMIPDPPEAE